MRFNAAKCNIIRVSRTCDPKLFNYSLTGQEQGEFMDAKYFVSIFHMTVVVLSLFSTQLVNCGTLYLPICNMLLTNICSRGMLKHIYGRNY